MECGKCNPYFRLENGKCVFIYSFEAIYDIYHLTNDINETTKLFNVENLADYEINKILVDDVYFENNTNYFKFDSVGEHKVRINIELNNSTSLKKFFENIKELISINFTNDFNTTGIENMTEMFSSSQYLISVDISNLNLENVKDMSYMFTNCKNLKDISISNFKTNKVENMAGMFEKCSLISLDLSNLDTKEAINMSNMFKDCAYLKNLKLDFNTEKVKTMKKMFSSCTSLTSLNISTFNTTNCQDFSNIFENDSKLQLLLITYKKCKNLYKEIPDDIYIFNVRDTPILGTINCTYNIRTIKDYVKLIGNNFELYSQFDMYLDNRYIESSHIYEIKTLGKHEVIFLLYQDLNMDYLFEGVEDLIYVDMKSNNNCRITSMRHTFEEEYNLYQFNITGFSGDKIRTMENLFNYAIRLYYCSFNNFDTKNLEDISYMFARTNITNSPLNDLNTSKVKFMSHLFYNC